MAVAPEELFSLYGRTLTDEQKHVLRSAVEQPPMFASIVRYSGCFADIDSYSEDDIEHFRVELLMEVLPTADKDDARIRDIGAPVPHRPDGARGKKPVIESDMAGEKGADDAVMRDSSIPKKSAVTPKSRHSPSLRKEPPPKVDGLGKASAGVRAGAAADAAGIGFIDTSRMSSASVAGAVHPPPRVDPGAIPVMVGRMAGVVAGGRSGVLPGGSRAMSPAASPVKPTPTGVAAVGLESTKIRDPVAAVTKKNFQEFSKHFTPSEIETYRTYLCLPPDELRLVCESKGIAVQSGDDQRSLATKGVVAGSPAKWESIAFPRPGPARSPPKTTPSSATAATPEPARESPAKPAVALDRIAIARQVFELTKQGFSHGDAMMIVQLSMDMDFPGVGGTTGGGVEAVAPAAPVSHAAPAARTRGGPEEVAPPAYSEGPSGVMRSDVRTHMSKRTVSKWTSIKDDVAAAGSIKTDQHTHFYILRVFTESWAVHWEDKRLEAAYQRYLEGTGPAMYKWDAQKPHTDPVEYDLMTVHFERFNAEAFDEGYLQFDCTKNGGYESAPLVRGSPKDGKILGFPIA